jgi:predicted phosphodiesterase
VARAPLSDEQLRTALEAVETHGTIVAAAQALGMPVSTLHAHVSRARLIGLAPPTGAQAPRVDGTTTLSTPELSERLLGALRKPRTLSELSTMLQASQGQVLDAVLRLREAGRNVHDFGGLFSLEAVPLVTERTFEYLSRPDGSYKFGVSSDQHLCSRYAREDVLAHLYDTFAEEGVDRVVNAGNWIDGEDEKNRMDLAVHGLEPQVDYLVDRYPQRPGIETWAVWGEDHEGWFARRESIDMGRFAERKMREAGRTDWHDLGFIEAKIDLVHAGTGARGSLVVMHPGGGSSYAYSYRPQKIVESLTGGEKPAVLVIGHYHKLSMNLIRNVWTVQAGCAEDQTVFMRKKNLDAHVGGGILTLRQDPRTGAIVRCQWDQLQYFTRGYYNDRWSKTGPVVQAPRILNQADAA